MKMKNVEDIYSLSPLQQGILFHTLTAPRSGIYFEQVTWTIRGGLNVAAFERAWQHTAGRHPILRTAFVWEGLDEPLQVVRRQVRLELAQQDWRGMAPGARRSCLENYLGQDRRRGFNLAGAPLMRLALIRLADDFYQFVWSYHHILLDGWAVSVVFADVFAAYEAFSRGQELKAARGLPYRAYIEWLRRQDLKKAEAYWRQALAGFTAPTPLNLARPRGDERQGGYAVRRTQLSEELTAGLQGMAREHRLTLNTLVQGAWALLLSRYSGEGRVAFGTVVSGRPPELPGADRAVGLFINTVPTLAHVPARAPLAAWLKEFQGRQAESRQYEYGPLVQVQGWSEVPRGLPLFESIVVFENHPVDNPLLDRRGGPELADITYVHTSTGYPLTLIAEPARQLELKINFDASRFDAPAVERMLGHLAQLLKEMAADPARSLAEIDLLTEDERASLSSSADATARDYAPGECIHELFEAQAARTHAQVAVAFEGEQLTYEELNARANQLARRLRRLGVRPEARVGLCVGRSPLMAVGLLGILKAGGAYVPLDPAYPRERLQFIVEDAGVEVLLTHSALADALPAVGGAQVVWLDTGWGGVAEESRENLPAAAAPENLAYVIYTSGSTGRPKGVGVEHGVATRHLAAIREEFDINGSDRVLQFASLSFDVSLEQILTALLTGARLVLRGDQLWGAADFIRHSAEDGLTVVNFPTAYWHQLARECAAGGELTSSHALKLAIIGGDMILPEAVRLWQGTPMGRVRLLNAYGPTEAAITAATFEIPEGSFADGASARRVPIGRPVKGRAFYVLDAHGRLAPVGVTGELHIGGPLLARGYLGRPELTAERFLPDPFSGEAGARLYRTGDLARLLPDGNVEFVGRVDNQVKVRGFRIELGEIEAALAEHEGIREAVVEARREEVTAGDKRLVAYVVPADGVMLTSAEVRGFLETKLPAYMQPSACVFLERLPLTPNGKVDRRALPAPEAAVEADDFVAPRTEAERALARVFAEVLGVERVGVHDNFFELGGDSILSIQIIARARRAGLNLKPKQIFDHPTVAELAALARQSGPEPAAEAETVTGEVPLTPIQRRFFEQEQPAPHHFNQSVMLEAREAPDFERLSEAVRRLLAHHDALRLRFTRDAGVWRQTCAGAEAEAACERVDLSNLPEAGQAVALEAAAAAAQAGMNLADGPLARVVLFDLGPSRPARLLLVVHHLAVDGVSWRILLEDLQKLYAQSGGEGEPLAPKTTSFKSWAERLAAHARSPALKTELAYWLAEPRRSVARLPVDREGAENTEASARSLTATLSVEETRALLQELPRAYQTQVNDALLTALAQTVARWARDDRVLVDLEGHGREEAIADSDLSRTVGWFTSLFPVLLDAGRSLAPHEALRSVREQLRAVPQRGIGYGLLRYLGGDGEIKAQLSALPQAEILFNYLGQFDQTLSPSSMFRLAPEAGGPGRGPLTRRQHLLEVNAAVVGGQLRVNWSYSENFHDRATVTRLADDYTKRLRVLVAHCLSPASRGYAPADFPLARLSQEALDGLLENHSLVEDIYPLSPAQQGILFHTLYSPEGGEYFGQTVWTLDGDVNVEALTQACQRAVERHPALRTAFAWEGLAEPLQIVIRLAQVPVRQEDWRTFPAAAQRERLAAFLAEDRRRGFELDAPPLMRLALIRLGDQTYKFVWSHHHLLLDGWSLSTVIREVLLSYESLCRGAQLSLEPTRPYRDYIAWLRRQDAGRAEAFWREHLKGFDKPTPLGIGRAPEGAAEGEGYGELKLRLSEATTGALRQLGRQHRLTLNTVVQGAWALLLSRYSGEEDVVFGAAVAGRPAELDGVAEMVGMFINTLPVRVRLDAHRPLLGWLSDLQAQQAEAREYEYSPLAEVQRWSDVRAGGLFESIVAFENYPVDALLTGRSAGGLAIRDVTSAERTNYPLSLVAAPGERQLLLCAIYDRGRFDGAAIRRLLGHVERLLVAIAADPHQRPSQLSLLSDDELRQLLVEWNDTAADYPRQKCVHELFEEQAQRTPERAALVYGGGQLSYAELNARANQLARHLRALGVGRGTLVTTYAERSFEMVVALLGVLKAGGAYVPLDLSYPQERLRFMLEDTQAPVLLTQRRLRGQLPEHRAQVVCLDEDWGMIARRSAENPPVQSGAEDLAYVIYTSGSTGRPKGVCVTHRAINRLLLNTDYIALGAGDRIAQASNASFDAATFEIWGALLHGACLVGISKEVAISPRAMAAAIQEQRISVMFLTTALFNQLASETPDCFRRVRQLMFGGEAVDPKWVREVLRAGGPSRLLHVYGPTENTTFSTWYLVREVGDGARTVPIGRPIANTQLYLLDGGMQPVPVGVAGELYVGGDGVARGYLGRPELTAERFLPDPFSGEAGARLYRTGDLARLLPDGNVEFVGRVDNQVKVRGFRIELGEIEAALNAYAGVRECAVLVREDNAGDKRLAAYVVAEAGAALSAGELRRYAKEKLPDYMVPSVFVMLDELPLTPNGKVDRRALPAPEAARRDPEDDDFVAPRTEAERALARVFAEVLGVERVGVHDNFFDLGGHSLLATQAVSRVRDLLRVELPLRDFFTHATVAEVAEIVEALRQHDDASHAPPLTRRERTGRLPLSFAQQRLWFLDQLQPGTPFYNLPLAVSLAGRLDARALGQALNEIVRRHEVLRTTFRSEGGEAAQVVAPALEIDMPVLDLSALAPDERERRVRSLAGEEARRPFDLEGGPLVRATLLRLAEDEHVVLLTMHHVVADGWSMGVLLREVAALYSAYARGAESPLAEPAIQYADFAVWQRELLRGEGLRSHADYWREQLEGVGVLELPTDRPRPEVQTFSGAYEPVALPKELSEAARTLGEREGATLFMVLLAAYQTLLSYYTGRDDINVGTDIANRNRGETEGLIGFFINQLVLRTDLSGDPTFRELLARVREVTLGAYAHQDMPFELLVEMLRQGRDLKHTPLFQVKLVLQNMPLGALELPGLALRQLPIDFVASKFDLTLLVSESPEGLSGNFEYNTDLFDATTVRRMASLFAALLERAVSEPDARVGALREELAEVEKKELAVEKTKRDELNRRRLTSIRPKSVAVTEASPVREEVLRPGCSMPLVVTPRNLDVDILGWAKNNRAAVEANLGKHGALLFRGFNVEPLAHFELLAGHLCAELFVENGEHPRGVVSGKVYTPVFYPPDRHLLWHNENSFNHRWPTKIMFACVTPAAEGGETPIADSRLVFERLDPAIRRRFLEKGVMYVRNYSQALGLDWQSVFQTDDRAKVEEACRRSKMEFEWKENGQLRTRCVRPAAVRHPATGEMTWFNQAQHWHISCLDPATRESLLALFSEKELPRHCYYGDGSPIEDSVMMEILDVYRSVEVSFPWRRGDIFVLDNLLAAHARNRFVGERKLLVAMGDMLSYDDV